MIKMPSAPIAADQKAFVLMTVLFCKDKLTVRRDGPGFWVETPQPAVPAERAELVAVIEQVTNEYTVTRVGEGWRYGFQVVWTVQERVDAFNHMADKQIEREVAGGTE